MMITSYIEPIPADQSGGTERKINEMSVEASTYEAGVEELRKTVPDGWRIMNFRRD